MRLAARLSFPATGISPKRARGSAPSLHWERSSGSNLCCRFASKLVPRSTSRCGGRSPIRIRLPSYGSEPADAMGFARRMRVCRQSTWPEKLSEVIPFLVSPFFGRPLVPEIRSRHQPTAKRARRPKPTPRIARFMGFVEAEGGVISPDLGGPDLIGGSRSGPLSLRRGGEAPGDGGRTPFRGFSWSLGGPTRWGGTPTAISEMESLEVATSIDLRTNFYIGFLFTAAGNSLKKRSDDRRQQKAR
jgi:hypothetical protein